MRKEGPPRLIHPGSSPGCPIPTGVFISEYFPVLPWIHRVVVIRPTPVIHKCGLGLWRDLAKCPEPQQQDGSRGSSVARSCAVRSVTW